MPAAGAGSVRRARDRWPVPFGPFVSGLSAIRPSTIGVLRQGTPPRAAGCPCQGGVRSMRKPTDPLREEHKGLLPHIEKLRKLADAVGEAPPETLRRDMDEGYAFLAQHLIPHAKAEDLALYPVVAKGMGAPQATATMSRDHLEVGRLTGELKRLLDRLGG